MFLLKNLKLLPLILTSLIFALPVFAHKVKLSQDVGATIHIEPNDTPRAGKSNLTWFALTRKGGKTIPLTNCKCTLSVYSQPYRPENTPLMKPSLKAVSAEGYQGIPGADITFPQAGAYELVLKGSPTRSGDFTPFELRFSVTVAR